MNLDNLFSEQQLDYLVEMLNIGAGNATTALHHLLQCEVHMKLPDVEVMSTTRVPAALGDPASPVVGLRMQMVGDLIGCLFFLVAEDQVAKLAELAERAMLGPKRENPDPEHVAAALAEIGNILAGVYLTALHDFCKLNVSHTVPVQTVDVLQSLRDESSARDRGEEPMLILVNNEFDVGKEQLRTFFLIFPSPACINVLVDSMKEAGKMYGIE